jgi:hypothetical protein
VKGFRSGLFAAVSEEFVDGISDKESATADLHAANFAGL